MRRSWQALIQAQTGRDTPCTYRLSSSLLTPGQSHRVGHAGHAMAVNRTVKPVAVNEGVKAGRYHRLGELYFGCGRHPPNLVGFHASQLRSDRDGEWVLAGMPCVADENAVDESV